MNQILVTGIRELGLKKFLDSALDGVRQGINYERTPKVRTSWMDLSQDRIPKCLEPIMPVLSSYDLRVSHIFKEVSVDNEEKISYCLSAEDRDSVPRVSFHGSFTPAHGGIDDHFSVFVEFRIAEKISFQRLAQNFCDFSEFSTYMPSIIEVLKIRQNAPEVAGDGYHDESGDRRSSYELSD
jgi:hypothetical protein